MKVKDYFVIMLLLSILVFCSACGNLGEKTADGTNAGNNSAGEINPPEERPRQNQDMPELFGQVQSIDGNEVTILVAEMPQLRERADRSFDQDKENNVNSQKIENQTENPAPAEKRDPMNDKMTFTGETQKVVIPEGTLISLGMGDKNTELRLSDIQNGMLLQIWFEAEDDSENKTIKTVRVMPES